VAAWLLASRDQLRSAADLHLLFPADEEAATLPPPSRRWPQQQALPEADEEEEAKEIKGSNSNMVTVVDKGEAERREDKAAYVDSAAVESEESPRLHAEGVDSDIEEAEALADAEVEMEAEAAEEAEAEAEVVADLPASTSLPLLSNPLLCLSPSLNYLRSLPPAALASVAGLRLTHATHGSVEWLRPVSVLGVDWDAAVAFHHGAVELADDHTPGTGLNQPARITLYGCRPSHVSQAQADKAARAIADRDADADAETKAVCARLQRYEEKLRKAAENAGGEMERYEWDSGAWTFTVEHF
jgi:hypothetical protein